MVKKVTLAGFDTKLAQFDTKWRDLTDPPI